jgi:peptide methionine sulfoxide reductase msrA/msrB
VKSGDETMEDTSLEKAIFAGGCFWHMEAAFEALDGAVDVASGYTGGQKENPTYEEVSSGNTGHYEAIQVTYDPLKITFEQLLDNFWNNIDPTDAAGQSNDRGPQYRTAIFYHNETQKMLAEKSKKSLEESGKFNKPIATSILPAREFYRAEEYHQDYYKKHAIRCKQY